MQKGEERGARGKKEERKSFSITPFGHNSQDHKDLKPVFFPYVNTACILCLRSQGVYSLTCSWLDSGALLPYLSQAPQTVCWFQVSGGATALSYTVGGSLMLQKTWKGFCQKAVRVYLPHSIICLVITCVNHLCGVESRASVLI